MANDFLKSVIDALNSRSEDSDYLSLGTAVEVFNSLGSDEDAMDFFESHREAFFIDSENQTLEVLDPDDSEEGEDEPDERDEETSEGHRYPIPPRDFQFNGKLIKLMNSMADDSTPEEGLYFAQFAKAAKENNLAVPPHEEKLLSYCKLYPKVFTITVDPVASQKIYIKPIKGFKSYRKDRKGFGSDRNQGYKAGATRGTNFHSAAPTAPERSLSLYSLSDFAYFPDLTGALKSLYEMAAHVDGCFLIEGDVNPYRMLWNKLERDFAEAVRREDQESEQLFVMSPIGADFPTGFTTPEGRRIIGSCVFNKTRNAQSYQAWRFTGFYVDEEA